MSLDTPAAIVSKFPNKIFALKADNMSQLLDDLRGYVAVKNCITFGEFHHVTFCYDDENLSNEMKICLEKANHQNVVIKEIAPTIEDCFMELTKNN
jgi:hypothetical protein